LAGGSDPTQFSNTKYSTELVKQFLRNNQKCTLVTIKTNLHTYS